MNIKIFQRDDYEFPKPAYGFGQTLTDSEDDEGFVVGMQFTSEHWEYQLFYTKLEVLSNTWVKEYDLASSTATV